VIAAVVILAGLVVGVAVLTSRGSSPDSGPVARVQPISLAPVTAGDPTAVVGAVPGRATVVAFFAAWCDPCRAELPIVESAWRAANAPAVVGIDVLDQRSDAQALLAHAGVTFPSGFDHDGTVSQRWGVVGLPVTVFVSADGRVVAYHKGPLTRAQLAAFIARSQSGSASRSASGTEFGARQPAATSFGPVVPLLRFS
jgi:cytochrome c biogenesis protein CcmG/thiol:disulfide interchange protein DsbE